MKTFTIDSEFLSALDDYDLKSKYAEKYLNLKQSYNGSISLKDLINDDLVFNVPIYDTSKRRYASFCSFTEAIFYGKNDIRGMGKFFDEFKINKDFDFFVLLYLFRLCGSGINYIPRTKIDKIEDIINTHGFGNFWIINSILNNRLTTEEWIEDLKNTTKPFTNNKGYLLPQFTFEGNNGNHLKKFILDYSRILVFYIIKELNESNRKLEIFEITDIGNKYLNSCGFKKQNFVLTAFAADLAEYYPNLVDPKSRVYAGTNATKCIKAIFRKNDKKYSDFNFINDVLKFMSDRYELNPIDCEDSRACDFVRYIQEYQSEYHLKINNGIFMKNNSILKNNQEKYQQLLNEIK